MRNSVKKFVQILAFVVALPATSLAWGATFNLGNLGDGDTGGLINTGIATGPFVDGWTFNLLQDSEVSVSFSSIELPALEWSIGADLSGSINGGAGLGTEFTLGFLGAGVHILSIAGTVIGSGGGGYSGGLGVAAVPLPAAAWLFGSAILGLTVVARRRRTTGIA